MQIRKTIERLIERKILVDLHVPKERDSVNHERERRTERERERGINCTSTEWH